MPAAGLPWFRSEFGRDSIFTSIPALPVDPNLQAWSAGAPLLLLRTIARGCVSELGVRS
jgi:glycogen debranching enzyme